MDHDAMLRWSKAAGVSIEEFKAQHEWDVAHTEPTTGVLTYPDVEVTGPVSLLGQVETKFNRASRDAYHRRVGKAKVFEWLLAYRLGAPRPGYVKVPWFVQEAYDPPFLLVTVRRDRRPGALIRTAVRWCLQPYRKWQYLRAIRESYKGD